MRGRKVERRKGREGRDWEEGAEEEGKHYDFMMACNDIR